MSRYARQLAAAASVYDHAFEEGPERRERAPATEPEPCADDAREWAGVERPDWQHATAENARLYRVFGADWTGGAF